MCKVNTYLLYHYLISLIWCSYTIGFHLSNFLCLLIIPVFLALKLLPVNNLFQRDYLCSIFSKYHQLCSCNFYVGSMVFRKKDLVMFMFILEVMMFIFIYYYDICSTFNQFQVVDGPIV